MIYISQVIKEQGGGMQRFGSVVQSRIDFEQQALNSMIGGGQEGAGHDGDDFLDDLDFEKEDGAAQDKVKTEITSVQASLLLGDRGQKEVLELLG
mmetsp:Transcript_1620/g.2865  ORF Transcript_1620/g.2865 Transcript_1620/m.2865 type:complete len:95 (+) Transcript_1620:373-657(+)|eukprot:CAMPEP_0168610498 /NCGR_PEP_ID=MMETSP0449_2-20121227/1820_1 /TAXON_ID=1082188 /ORGANISM="Strombidium rassoulzadegani, Strain ras09" /LENGTH=94 /DNA_ID=CAMNT_0008650809 /DNA_START=285 /DNA_END=569 /DNA_ORIENTATION=-